MAERCPTCGAPVEVYTGSEGTSSYTLVSGADQLRDIARTVFEEPARSIVLNAADQLESREGGQSSS